MPHRPTLARTRRARRAKAHSGTPRRRSLRRSLATALLGLVSFDANATAATTYACQPALSVFCRNIHVACAGATRRPTAPFQVTISGTVAHIKIDGTSAATTGQVSQGSAILIAFQPSGDWIRITSDGRYSHRIYRDARAAMSYGTCRLLPP